MPGILMNYWEEKYIEDTEKRENVKEKLKNEVCKFPPNQTI